MLPASGAVTAFVLWLAGRWHFRRVPPLAVRRAQAATVVS